MNREITSSYWLKLCFSAVIALMIIVGQSGVPGSTNANGMDHGEMCGHVSVGSHAHDLADNQDLTKVQKNGSLPNPGPTSDCHTNADGHCAASCALAMLVSSPVENLPLLSDAPIAHGNPARVDGWLSGLKRPPRI